MKILLVLALHLGVLHADIQAFEHPGHAETDHAPLFIYNS